MSLTNGRCVTCEELFGLAEGTCECHVKEAVCGQCEMTVSRCRCYDCPNCGRPDCDNDCDDDCYGEQGDASCPQCGRPKCDCTCCDCGHCYECIGFCQACEFLGEEYCSLHGGGDHQHDEGEDNQFISDLEVKQAELAARNDWAALTQPAGDDEIPF